MARTFSVYRRRQNLVDLFINRRANVASYQFKVATNFDIGFSLFDTIPVRGKKSATVLDSGLVGEQFATKTRFLFNPNDYSIDDSKPFYTRVTPVFTDGSLGTEEGIQFVLPYNTQPNRPIIVRGTAPNQASLSTSLEINLPNQVNNMSIQVNGTANLYVAFEPTGAEYKIFPVSPLGMDLVMNLPSFSQLFVRGDAATTEFNAILTLRNNPGL